MTAKIEVCKDKKLVLPIEKFVNGRLDPAHANLMTCRLLGRTGQSNLQQKDQKIMVAESPHMTYIGKNYGQSNIHSKSVMKHFVGVLDRTTGKMQIFETEMFNMQPHMPGKEDGSEEVIEKTYKEKTDMLTTAFGSARQKRALDTKIRHAVDDTTLSGVLNSAINHGLQEVQVYKQKNEEGLDDSDQATTPPCNRDADKVEDVYKLSDILSPGDMNDLQNSAAELFNCDYDSIETWRKEDKYPAYILTKLRTLPLGEAARWKSSKCLVYLSYLVHLFRLTQKQLQNQNALPTTWPLSIRQKMLENFTLIVEAGSKKKRFIPSRLKDRLACYILVLALLIDEYNLPLTDLQKDLRLGKQKIMFYTRALGCKLVQQKVGEEKVAVAQLKLPLTFPTTRQQRRN